MNQYYLYVNLLIEFFWVKTQQQDEIVRLWQYILSNFKLILKS